VVLCRLWRRKASDRQKETQAKKERQKAQAVQG